MPVTDPITKEPNICMKYIERFVASKIVAEAISNIRDPTITHLVLIINRDKI
jgi:hypothetical protein